MKNRMSADSIEKGNSKKLMIFSTKKNILKNHDILCIN